MAYVYLFIAIFFGSYCCYYDPLYRQLYRTVTDSCYGYFRSVVLFYFFSLSLKRGMNIGIGYSIWSGVGVLAVALIGVMFLDDRLTVLQIGGVLLIIGGLAAVQLGGETASDA